jgi:hypothetical protein
MWKTLAAKELRETGLIALAALAIYAYFLANAMRFRLLPFLDTERDLIPFVGGAFIGPFVCVSAGLAIAVGFRQSAWESMQSTFLFLLHRPMSWWKLLGAKLTIGLSVYIVSAAIPILLYAWWAGTPGTHASPFEWSMTWPMWKIAIAMTSVYFAAFLCGIRPAHWLGSRLWPLAGAGALVFLIQYVPWWPILGIGTVVLLNTVQMVTILSSARNRDYS